MIPNESKRFKKHQSYLPNKKKANPAFGFKDKLAQTRRTSGRNHKGPKTLNTRRQVWFHSVSTEDGVGIQTQT